MSFFRKLFGLSEKPLSVKGSDFPKHFMQQQSTKKQQLQSWKSSSNMSSEERELEKCIRNSSLFDESNARLVTTDMQRIRDYIEGRKKISSDIAILRMFTTLEGAPSDLHVASRLKILSILHKFIMEQGEPFALALLDHKLLSIITEPTTTTSTTMTSSQIRQQSLSPSPTAARTTNQAGTCCSNSSNINNNPTSQNKRRSLTPAQQQQQAQQQTFLYEHLLQPYYNYVLRLANNLQIYKICTEEGQLPEQEDSRQEYKVKFMWLFKLSNMLGYLIQMHSKLTGLLRSSVAQIYYLQDIALLVLHDCASYYNLMSLELDEIVSNYHVLSAIDFLQFYAIYTEMVGLTREMRAFTAEKYLFDHGELIEIPSWFVVEVKVHREIEDYATKIQLLNASAERMRIRMKQVTAAAATATAAVAVVAEPEQENNEDQQGNFFEENKQQQRISHSISHFTEGLGEGINGTTMNGIEENNISRNSSNNSYSRYLSRSTTPQLNRSSKPLKQQLDFRTRLQIDNIPRANFSSENSTTNLFLMKKSQIEEINKYDEFLRNNKWQGDDEDDEDDDEEEEDTNEVDSNPLGDDVEQIQQVASHQMLREIQPSLDKVNSDNLAQGILLSPSKYFTFRCKQQQQQPVFEDIVKENMCFGVAAEASSHELKEQIGSTEKCSEVDQSNSGKSRSSFEEESGYTHNHELHSGLGYLSEQQVKM